jgi:hypothetical protein
VVVEERVVGGQLLARADVAHGYQDDVAREAHAGLAGVVDEQHDRLVLSLIQGDQVKAVGDLDLGSVLHLSPTLDGRDACAAAGGSANRT